MTVCPVGAGQSLPQSQFAFIVIISPSPVQEQRLGGVSAQHFVLGLASSFKSFERRFWRPAPHSELGFLMDHVNLMTTHFEDVLGTTRIQGYIDCKGNYSLIY
jgi:hypothetical protein